jgi:SAM-dependent methyltransferase
VRRPYYDQDLAFIHDAGYGDFARAAAPGLVSLLRRAGVERGTVVELGCGSGAATRALVAAGHDVLAIDASPAMLRLARRRVAGARFARGRLPGVTIPPCDAVVAVGEVVNYMAGPAAFERLFRRVVRALRPGGLFVFDVKEPGRGASTMAHGRVGRDWAVISRSTEDRAGGTLTRAITSFRRVGRGYRRRDETHQLTLLSTRELTRRLRAAGFLVRVAHGYGRARLPPGLTVLVARRL